MNLSVLKSPGTWVTLLSAVLGLLVSNGVILSGSTTDTVIGYVLALAGALTGHMIALPSAPAAPASTSTTAS